MMELVLFCLPTLAYVILQSRREDRTTASALRHAGASWGSPSAYGWALLILPPLLLAGWLAIVLIPPAALQTPGVSITRLTSMGAVMAVMARALGEEVFFRGLLGGALVRRLGFAKGNLMQAIAFLLPHLPLLLIDARVWPVLPLQFAVGWLLGWLRHRAGTFLPGAVVHAVANIAAGWIVL